MKNWNTALFVASDKDNLLGLGIWDCPEGLASRRCDQSVLGIMNCDATSYLL